MFSVLLQTYNPKTCSRKFVGIRTIEQALAVKCPTIAKMTKMFGTEKVEAYIKLWLINLNEVINLKRTLKEHQIDECAMLLVQQFKNVTIADINLIFTMAKTGEHGDLYESLSIDKIIRWFRTYFEQRCEVAAIQSQRQADKFKYSAEKTPRTQGAIDEIYNEFKKQYDIQQLKNNHKPTDNGNKE